MGFITKKFNGTCTEIQRMLSFNVMRPIILKVETERKRGHVKMEIPIISSNIANYPVTNSSFLSV